MKRADCRENYYYFSGKASEVARQLAFAGLALIWIFKTEPIPAQPAIPIELLIPSELIILSLTLDLLHYTFGAAAWGGYNRYLETGASSDKEFKAPRFINWPTLFLFWTKLASVGAAYLLLIIFLLKKLQWTV